MKHRGGSQVSINGTGLHPNYVENCQVDAKLSGVSGLYIIQTFLIVETVF